MILSGPLPSMWTRSPWWIRSCHFPLVKLSRWNFLCSDNVSKPFPCCFSLNLVLTCSDFSLSLRWPRLSSSTAAMNFFSFAGSCHRPREAGSLGGWKGVLMRFVRRYQLCPGRVSTRRISLKYFFCERLPELGMATASCCSSNILGAGGAAAAPKVAYTKSLPGGGSAEW